MGTKTPEPMKQPQTPNPLPVYNSKEGPTMSTKSETCVLRASVRFLDLRFIFQLLLSFFRMHWGVESRGLSSRVSVKRIANISPAGV